MAKTDKTLTIDTTGLDPGQVRSLRSLVFILQHIMQTDNEEEFFNGSAEALRIYASSLWHSKFITSPPKDSNDIPYAEQALEYSIEVLQEYINTAKIIQYDN